AQSEQIVRVQRAGLDPNHGVAVFRHGIGPIGFKGDLVDGAVRTDYLGFHGYLGICSAAPEERRIAEQERVMRPRAPADSPITPLDMTIEPGAKSRPEGGRRAKS